ncbi:MAG: transglutaminase-like domain-containing protein, partial [Phycisphaerales bacterium]|nr:transglutaminase-like domain-containing protein [Phycisphaerales bacterium]
SVHEDLGEVATPGLLLPERVVPRGVIEDGGVDPVLADEFIFVPGLKTLAVGSTVEVVLDAPVWKPLAPGEPLVDVEVVLGRYPEGTREALRRQLSRAGANAGELLAALRDVRPGHRESMAYLVAGMPSRDLVELPAWYLLENVALAHASFEASPFAQDVPHAVFLDSVLPYAHINERRDDWRSDFTDRFRDVAWSAASQEEAVRRLNAEVYKTFDVTYHANKRFKNEQSPYQSIDQNSASCTGLSILLANACRSAGIPARLAGIPEWPTGDNHTWVEVWDGDRWEWVEAFSPGAYRQAWWTGKVGAIAAEDHAEPRYRIWAATWQRPEGVPNRFPLWWLTPADDPIPGEDRTGDYVIDRAASPGE